MAVKILWSGKFRINNEDSRETAKAFTDEQALYFMSQKIALKKGVLPHVVWDYLKSHPHSYEIKPAEQ